MYPRPTKHLLRHCLAVTRLVLPGLAQHGLPWAVLAWPVLALPGLALPGIDLASHGPPCPVLLRLSRPALVLPCGVLYCLGVSGLVVMGVSFGGVTPGWRHRFGRIGRELEGRSGEDDFGDVLGCSSCSAGASGGRAGWRQRAERYCVGSGCVGSRGALTFRGAQRRCG